MDRKKELKRQYKAQKPTMGVIIIKCKVNGKCHVQAAKDLRAAVNGAEVRIEGGFHPCAELAEESKQFGPGNFTIEVLDELSYDADDSKTDYTEELDFLQKMWEEKLIKENCVLYKKRI